MAGQGSVSRGPFQSTIIDQSSLLPGILGLRGIAAIAVFLFHLVHIGNISVPEPFEFISQEFGKGVQLFFVLSAFSLMHSTRQKLHRSDWMIEYFIKRFFRIAPLYYLMMLGMIFWPRIVSGAWQFDFETILLNLTFTFGFAPWTGIVWAGWSVGVEMIFYAIFPVLLMTIRTPASTLMLVVISIFVTYAARTLLDAHYEHTVWLYQYNWGYFSFAGNLCFFALGMYAFQVVNQPVQARAINNWVIPGFALGMLGLLLFTNAGSQLKQLWNAEMIAWGIGLASLCAWQATRPGRWAANRVCEFLGERSYSIYLLHPVVIVLFRGRIEYLYDALTQIVGSYAYFLCAAIVFVPLIILAEITYRMVEVPFIRFGWRVNNQRRLTALPA